MKKVIIFLTGIVISTIVLAQVPSTNPPVQKGIYSDQIQIKADDGKLMAVIGTDGKTALTANYTYDDIINTLIVRMIAQNKQYQDNMQMAGKLIEDAKARAMASSQKAAEIFQIWNPPPQPAKQEVKKEEPKKEVKKTFWEKLSGK